MTEVTSNEVFSFLDSKGRDCFSLTPSNEGFLFQINKDIEYVDGVKFDACDILGGCRCQAFTMCEPSTECDCFTPYHCEDHDGLFRCFKPKACDAKPASASVLITFNKACVPTSLNSPPSCQESFEGLLAASLSTCVRGCRFDGSVRVLDDTRIVMDVRSANDVDDIIDCVNFQYVGAYDCFAVSAQEVAMTTSTSTTSTTTSTFTTSEFDTSVPTTSTFETSTASIFLD